jgi:excisionase family DNA binding protein
VGKFFHSFSAEGKLSWQGQIVGKPHPGFYLVELFSWMTGSPDGGKVIPIEDIARNWKIYETSEEMGNNLPSEFYSAWGGD